MKKIITVVMLILSNIMLAQELNIKGRIVNLDDRSSSDIEIILLDKDSVIIKNAYLDKDYFFSMQAEKGIYQLKIKNAENILFTKEIYLSQDVDLGNIDVVKFNEIKEVTIEAQKKIVERKPDRLVFNFEQSDYQSGGNLIDALQVTPGVIVKNEKISIMGKEGVSVMVDDVLIRLSDEEISDFLKTMPSDNIKSIEVITMPSSKYEASGNRGIINIVLKKAKKNHQNMAIRSSYKQARSSSGNLGADFNFKKNKISSFSSINIGSLTQKNIDRSSLYYPDERWENNSPIEHNNQFLSARFGLDYDLTDRISLGFQYLGSYSEINTDENNIRSDIYDYQENLKSYISSIAKSNSKNNFNQFNFHGIYKLDSSGKKISYDLDYFSTKNTGQSDYSGNDFNPNHISTKYFAASNNATQLISNYSGKIDFEIPVKWAKFYFGGKLYRSETNNDIASYKNDSGTAILDPSGSNEFEFIENYQALYLSSEKKLGEKWELNLGLRAENTQTEGYSKDLDQKNTNNYLEIFPTAYIAYKANEKHSFNLSYGKRIQRPSYKDLNPFRMYDNPYSYTEGNPALKPSYRQNLEFIYTFGNLESKVYYSYQKDGFEQLGILDADTKITRYFVLNFLKTNEVGISESFSFKPLHFWNNRNSFDINYTKTESYSSVTRPSLEGWNGSFSTNNQFFINTKKTLSFSLDYWIIPPGVNGMDETTTSQSLSVAFRFLMLDKNLQLSLSARDILKTQNTINTSYSNDIKTVYRNSYDNQSFTLSLYYKFGNKKIDVEKRDFGNEDERNRTGI